MTPLANPLDWRWQVEARPLLSVSAAFIGGVILGGVTSGNDDREASCYQYDPSRSQYHPGERRNDRSPASAVRSAVRASGVEETFSSAATAALTIAGQRVKEVIDERYPGLSERYASSKKAEGGISDHLKAAADENDRITWWSTHHVIPIACGSYGSHFEP